MTKQKAFTKEFEDEAVRLADEWADPARTGGEPGRRAVDADAMDQAGNKGGTADDLRRGHLGVAVIHARLHGVECRLVDERWH